jgi:hypothetical protein
MILDERTEFADATALALSTGRGNVGDVIPLSQARNVGSPPRPLYLVVQVTTAITGPTSVAFELVSDAVNPPATDGSATVHLATKSIPVASLTANAVLAVLPLPGEPPAYEPYLGLQQNVTGSAVGAGAVNAFLVHDPKQWKAYADAI